MTTQETWLAILHNISDEGPLDLDTLLGLAPKSMHAAAPDFPAVPDRIAPSSQLWTRPANGISFIGIRVTAPVPDIAALAYRLAAAAVERRVIPIILSSVAPSGFERFGFRTERLFGATEADRARVEAELIAFWNLAIVIDAADVAFLA
jgi:hypothetical protein